MDFYAERKYCKKCRRYVRYLMSLNHSYCIHCDARVQIFSKEDMKRFHRSPLMSE